MTDRQILNMIPKSKLPAIDQIWQDSDGIWIVLNVGWNADGMDYPARTIHCGGESYDEEDERTKEALDREDLKYQISQIRKLTKKELQKLMEEGRA